jgi:hypothetical protein
VRPTELSGALDIDAWGRTCAIDEKGGVLCWGGEGLVVPEFVHGITDARAVDHQCALVGDQSLWCWGTDRVGFNMTDYLRASALSTGYNGGCALNEQGGLACWGLSKTWSDGAGACSDPGACGLEYPEFEPDVAQVTMGLDVGWLRSEEGLILEIVGGIVKREVSLPSPAVDVSAGYGDACAVLDDGRVSCWRAGNSQTLSLNLTETPRTFGLCDAY